MTQRPRAPLRNALALVFIVFCLALLTYLFWPIHGLLLQIYAITALVVLFQAAPPTRQWMATTPLPHRIVFYVLIAAVVAGHFSLSPRKYFPFVAWDIFSAVSEKETVFCHELIGTTASNKKVRLLVEQLYPSIVQFDLPSKDQSETMDLLVAAMARTYNAQHADDPLREVDLMLMAVKLHLPPGETRSQPSCELLQRFELSSGPSS